MGDRRRRAPRPVRKRPLHASSAGSVAQRGSAAPADGPYGATGDGEGTPADGACGTAESTSVAWTPGSTSFQTRSKPKSPLPTPYEAATAPDSSEASANGSFRSRRNS